MHFVRRNCILKFEGLMDKMNEEEEEEGAFNQFISETIY